MVIAVESPAREVVENMRLVECTDAVEELLVTSTVEVEVGVLTSSVVKEAVVSVTSLVGFGLACPK